ncbi:ribonuclease HII [Klugiella xanthotipulae]|uniref:Ribonuclease n=1 Tax=Klugiella xanthotipulae TaxID=244735 RepID=A0A543HRV7_9MICO|nr:ribonuclease HII [Klugiella xanthotipulae]TQM61077.1 RNase HII [Klugiella xanthotipulae]
MTGTASTRGPARQRLPKPDPDLNYETELLCGGVPLVIGCDEVGRGAIAGPVAVGVAAYRPECGAFPEGLRDSKLLTSRKRDELYPLAAGWAAYWAVGYASADEIDRCGITVGLGLAGRRALVSLHDQGAPVASSVILLDGSSDWLSPALVSPLRIVTRVKADQDCASVAAASVLAKVHRDRHMIVLDAELPGYGWGSNKGYGAASHYVAIRARGVSVQHRQTWLK